MAKLVPMEGERSGSRHRDVLPGFSSELTSPLVAADAQARGSRQEQLFRLAHPPGNDFHRNEYGGDGGDGALGGEQCLKCGTADPPELQGPRGRALRVALTLLGAAPSLTWSSIYLSVAFFQSVLGPSVLSALGLAQDITALAGMLLYFGARASLPYGASIAASLAYKAAACLAIPGIVLLTGTILPGVLYGITALNGLTTGLAQALVGSVGGLLPGSKADELILVGSAIASLAPTSLQALLLVLTPVGVPLTPEGRLYVMFPVAFAGVSAAIWASRRVCAAPTFVARLAIEQARLRKLDKEQGQAKVKGRLNHIKWYALGEVLTWTIGLFLTAVTPYLQSCTSPPDSSWSAMLPTVLLIVFNLGNFLGATSAKRLQAWRGPALVQRLSARCGFLGSSMLALGCAARLLFAAFVCAWMFWRPLGHDAVAVGVYALAAVSNGFYTVVLSGEAQKLCGFQAQHLCPVVGTLIWISMQIGVLLGIAASAVAGDIYSHLAM